MKYSSLIAILLAGSTAAAQPIRAICTGPIEIENPWAGPVVRQIIVEVDTCANQLNANNDSSVTIQAVSPFPLEYQGQLSTDGTQEQKIVDPDSGDVFTFRLNFLADGNVDFEINMFTGNMDRIGGSKPTRLNCQALP